jgi:hypothetical protein
MMDMQERSTENAVHSTRPNQTYLLPLKNTSFWCNNMVTRATTFILLLTGLFSSISHRTLDTATVAGYDVNNFSNEMIPFRSQTHSYLEMFLDPETTSEDRCFTTGKHSSFTNKTTSSTRNTSLLAQDEERFRTPLKSSHWNQLECFAYGSIAFTCPRTS